MVRKTTKRSKRKNSQYEIDQELAKSHQSQIKLKKWHEISIATSIRATYKPVKTSSGMVWKYEDVKLNIPSESPPWLKKKKNSFQKSIPKNLNSYAFSLLVLLHAYSFSLSLSLPISSFARHPLSSLSKPTHNLLTLSLSLQSACHLRQPPQILICTLLVFSLLLLPF